MNYFYHVARNDISELKVFELVKNDWYIENDSFYNKEEFQILKQQLYPNGISKHGCNYLHHIFNIKENQSNNEIVPFSLEIIFEYVRRGKYPNNKSRFETVFGCLTLDDAKKIRAGLFSNKGVIYKVSCETFFIADMSLLHLSGSIIGMEIIADKYWSGKSSDKPFWEVLMDCPVRMMERIE